MHFLILALAMMPQATPAAPRDAKITDLGDGYVRVVTSSYQIEVPKGWRVTPETPWGSRDAAPGAGSGKLGVMTAGPSEPDWERLYQTSLYFIQRESPGKPTPYRLSKGPRGYDAMSFEILDKNGWAERRYVMLRSPEGRLLALSVKVPSKEAEKDWERHFKRMVSSAVLGTATR